MAVLQISFDTPAQFNSIHYRHHDVTYNKTYIFFLKNCQRLASIKRLEYMIGENALVGEKDWEVAKKTNKLKDELKQIQIQLIDVPIEFTNDLTEEELNRYFNSPKVNKKYRLKTR